jgi:hypothetical protein
MTKQLQRRSQRVQKTPLQVKVADAAKVRRLPLPGPGIVVNVPLHLLPAYLELHGLEPLGKEQYTPVGRPLYLLVKRTGKMNDGKKADLA